MTRARLGLAAGLAAAAVVIGGPPAGGAAAPAVSGGAVRIAFAGSGRQTLADYKQWIFQADQECYYDRDVRQTATFQWTTSFPSLGLARLSRPSGRALSGLQTTATGAVSGPELRGDCGSDDVPPGWVETIPCDQQLQFSGAGSLEVRRGKRGSAVLVVRAPSPSVTSPTTCSLIARGQELVDGVKLDLARLQKLRGGQTLRLPVGSISEVNCSTHPAPYEGTAIVDDCHDTLTWHGTITITRS